MRVSDAWHRYCSPMAIGRRWCGKRSRLLHSASLILTAHASVDLVKYWRTEATLYMASYSAQDELVATVILYVIVNDRDRKAQRRGGVSK